MGTGGDAATLARVKISWYTRGDSWRAVGTWTLKSGEICKGARALGVRAPIE